MESLLHFLGEIIVATFATVSIVSFIALFFVLMPTRHTRYELI